MRLIAVCLKLIAKAILHGVTKGNKIKRPVGGGRR